MQKYFLIIFFLSVLNKNIEAQTIINQIDSVTYFDDKNDEVRLIKKKYAIMCADFIREYYANKLKVLIYLDIKIEHKLTNDTVELAYDNLYGNAMDNNTYERSSKYYLSGIRIKLHQKTEDSIVLLKLLEYSINNMQTIKNKMEMASKQNYYDRPVSPVLSRKKIDLILKKKESNRIKLFFTQWRYSYTL